MAEKEERILIKKQINYHPPYGGWRRDGKEIVLTRQDAIEKMAKALFHFQYDGGLSFENAYDGAKKEFRLFAEAALNALLYDK